MDLIKKSCFWYPIHVDRTERNGNRIKRGCDRGQLVDLINDTISCLDPQKASGPDDISHRMLIANTNTICSPLCKLFNLYLRKKCFSSFWKLANVIAVFRNYRSISLLICVGKMFERTVFKYVLTISFDISIYINFSLAFSLDIPLHIK